MGREVLNMGNNKQGTDTILPDDATQAPQRGVPEGLNTTQQNQGGPAPKKTPAVAGPLGPKPTPSQPNSLAPQGRSAAGKGRGM